MEEMDTAKEWFVMREGQQFGPVSFADLKFEAERGELNPRLDTVWKSGMADWIPSGELDGLFARNDVAKAAEQAKEAAGNFTGYIPPETEEERERIKGNWPGVGRGTYFFILFIFPVILGMGLGASKVAFGSRIEPAMLENISSGLLFVCFIISIMVTLKRYQNLAMSRWWFIASIVPFLYPWLQYRLFACPPGYAFHKKLDGLGWVLAFIYWLLFLLVVAAIGFVVFVFTQSGPDDSYRVMIEGFVDKLGEAQKAAEEARKKP